jgi:hypothetical protein
MQKIEFKTVIQKSLFAYLLIVFLSCFLINWPQLMYHRFQVLKTFYTNSKGKDPNVSIRFLEDYDKLNPNQLPVLQELAYNYLKIGDVFSAKEIIKQALDMVPKSDRHYQELIRTYQLLESHR